MKTYTEEELSKIGSAELAKMSKEEQANVLKQAREFKKQRMAQYGYKL